jgi:hypothetical protein
VAGRQKEGCAKEQEAWFLKLTSLPQAFLAAPEDANFLNLYCSAAEDFQLKIVAKREDCQSFDEIIETVTGQLPRSGSSPAYSQKAGAGRGFTYAFVL